MAEDPRPKTSGAGSLQVWITLLKALRPAGNRNCIVQPGRQSRVPDYEFRQDVGEQTEHPDSKVGLRLQIPAGHAHRACAPPRLRREGEGAEGAPLRAEEAVAAAGNMDNAGKEREAVQLMAEAEKRVKASHSFLRGLFG